jgi:coenzyme F420-reducing hydrogenase delta subunit
MPNGAMVTSSLILDTFKMGAEAVYIGTCEAGSDPYSPQCAEVALKNVNKAAEALRDVGIAEERLSLNYHVTGVPGKFLNNLTKLEKIVEAKGKIPSEKRERLP